MDDSSLFHDEKPKGTAAFSSREEDTIASILGNGRPTLSKYTT